VGASDGDVDFIFKTLGGSVTTWLVDVLAGAGAHLVGRKTYEDMASHWPTSSEPFATPMNTIPKVVFSKTLREASWGETRIARGDLLDEVEKLKREDGKYLLAHGGSGFVQALVRHDLVDEYRLLVHPVAIGAGLPLFPTGPRPAHLKLVSSTPHDNGTLVNVYRRD
jgi:dihydrofolate reductase